MKLITFIPPISPSASSRKGAISSLASRLEVWMNDVAVRLPFQRPLPSLSHSVAMLLVYPVEVRRSTFTPGSAGLASPPMVNQTGPGRKLLRSP